MFGVAFGGAPSCSSRVTFTYELKGHSWQVLRERYWMPGLKPRLVASKANTLPSVLSFRPQV